MRRDIREVNFGTSVMASHCYFGDKKKIRTSFKSLVSKKSRTWRLKRTWESVYLKDHFVFLINWNTKLEIKFWFSFLYWSWVMSWDIKHKTKWLFDFQNNWKLKFKFEARFLFFILIWKRKNQICKSI